MSWFNKFLTSSLGQKVTMSLTGIFLMLFLIVHLLGNLQLLAGDGGEAFNIYAYVMTHFLPITVVSYLLYASILLHAYQGILLWLRNMAARGRARYAVHFVRQDELISRNMARIGIILFLFIVLHMYQYWFVMHWGGLPFVEYDGFDHPVRDLYTVVAKSYTNLGFVIFYVISMAIVGFHLWHGFWSSFQTLGLGSSKYAPLIEWTGKIYAVGVSVLFAIIPVFMYFNLNL